MKPGTPARTECAVLLAVCAVLYLTGLGDVPFYTRGEPREGNVVREMLATGRWLVPVRPEGEPARKPPLYYWSAAAAWSAAPDSPEYALRLPSVLYAVVGVLGTWAVVRTVVAPAAGWPAALVLATAFEWTRAAVVARVDMALAAGTTLLFLGWALRLGRGGSLGLWLAAVGAVLGALAKGPVAIILPGIAVVGLSAWERDARLVWTLRAPLVLGAGVVGIGCWYAAAIAQEGPAYWDILIRENLLRFVDAEKGRTGHHAPTWYLFAVGAVGFLPWTTLLPLGLGARSDDPAQARVLRFAKVWSIGVLVFFSVASAKRSVYLLPLFPALALLIGAGVAAPPTAGRWQAASQRLSAFVPGALAVMAFVLGSYGVGADPAAWLVPWLRADDQVGALAISAVAAPHAVPLALLSLATLAMAVRLGRQNMARRWSGFVSGLGGLMVVWVAVFDGLLHPGIAHARSVRKFMERVGSTVAADAPLHAIYPPDPGLRFYVPRPLRAWPREGTAEPAYILLWEDEWQRFADASGAALRPQVISDAVQAGRGHLLLVRTTGGALRRVAPPAGGDRATGLHAAP